MAKNISILGASYSDVPAVTLPTTQGGTASFTDITDTTATNEDVVEGKVFYSANGVRTTGTGISRNQVQTLVEENKVKHVYGIDGYEEVILNTIYFDENKKLYTIGENDTKIFWTENDYQSLFSNLFLGKQLFIKINNKQRQPLEGFVSFAASPPYQITLKPFITKSIGTIDSIDNEFIISFNEEPAWTSPFQIGKLEPIKSSQNNSLCAIVENHSNNIAEGNFSHSEGNLTQAVKENSHAEGDRVIAYGTASHAEGKTTQAAGSCSHAEGYNTIASGTNTHAEGKTTQAIGSCSHAEGNNTTTPGTNAHAEGYYTIASGINAHAEGNNTIALGTNTHAEGYYTTANHKSQHVFGQYNIEDPSSNNSIARGDYVEIVGNGTSSTRSNARTLDWSGNESLAGSLTLGKNTANEATLTANDITAILDSVDNYTGNAADATVETVTASTAKYPVPAAGDSLKVIIGKITKFFADIVQTFTGATASAVGKKGLVPAPAAGRNTYYLRGDGTWQAPVNGSTTTAAGRVLDARQANPNVSGSLAADVKALNDSLAVETVSVTITISGVSNTLWIYKDKVGLTFEMNNQTEITSTIPDNVWTDIAAWPTSLPLPRGNIVSVPLVNNQVMVFRVINGRLQYHFRSNGLGVYLQGTGYNLHV